MPSIRSQAINCVARLYYRLGGAKEVPIAKLREKYARMDKRVRGKIDASFEISDHMEPITGRWIRSRDNSSKGVILYLHGGAFQLRLPEMHSLLASKIAKPLGFDVFMPWYRLAPEHPFPAAPEDCLSAYRFLLKVHLPQDIIIIGDSAGGNLTLALLNALETHDLPKPRAAVALSPVTDFTQIGATWLTQRWEDPMYPVQAQVNPQLHYMCGENLTDPLASPIYGDLCGNPPTLILAGSLEALRDDCVTYVRKSYDAGNLCHLHIWKGMPHVHMLMDFLPEARQAHVEVVNWLQGIAPGGSIPNSKPDWRNIVTLYSVDAFTGSLKSIGNG